MIAQRIKACGLSADDERAVQVAISVSGTIWRRAAMGRVVNADAHMAICAALHIDPVTCNVPAPTEPYRGPVQWFVFGAALNIRRTLNGHSIRTAAPAAGVSSATFSRAENGQILSFDALARLCAYIGMHPNGYTSTGQPGAWFTGNTHCNALKTLGAADA